MPTEGARAAAADDAAATAARREVTAAVLPTEGARAAAAVDADAATAATAKERKSKKNSFSLSLLHTPTARRLVNPCALSLS